MTRKQTIAGVVLTLNEEQDLARALRSLSWCDELLVVDSGSTDRTQLVAESLGARFVQHKQNSPFLITVQRNWALEHCGLVSDWVLFLDSDEEVGLELANAIQNRISLVSDINAYELTPRYWFFGRWLKLTQGYPNWHPRLLRRGSVSFEGGVWETFSHDANVEKIGIPYEHFAFSKGLDDWLERHSRYATWEAQKIFDYHSTKDIGSFGTRRKLRRRQLSSYLGLLRPPARFIQKYIINYGFLEGSESLVFSLMMAFYELMIYVKLVQLQRKSQGLPL